MAKYVILLGALLMSLSITLVVLWQFHRAFVAQRVQTWQQVYDGKPPRRGREEWGVPLE